MSIITLFAFDDQIDCHDCVDPKLRSAWRNERLMIWLIIGWVAIVIHIITSYFI